MDSQNTFAPAGSSSAKNENRPSNLSVVESERQDEVHNGKTYKRIQLEDDQGEVIDALIDDQGGIYTTDM